MSVVFSRASGVSWFLACSAPDCWGGWRVAGGSGVRGLVRPGVLLPSCWGAGLGCACARLSVLLPPCWGAGSGARVARFPWWGSGCARFPVRVRGVVVVFAGGFRVLFFSVRRFSCLLVLRVLGPLLGCGFRGVGGLWGCRVGFGVFSPASAVLARACLGLGWVLFGEFDPGSGRTLAACLTHASRTGPPLWGWVEWRTGEYHVSNLPPAPG